MTKIFAEIGSKNALLFRFYQQSLLQQSVYQPLEVYEFLLLREIHSNNTSPAHKLDT